MNNPALTCETRHRRNRLADAINDQVAGGHKPTINGIDFVEVVEAEHAAVIGGKETTLVIADGVRVHFLTKSLPQLTSVEAGVDGRVSPQYVRLTNTQGQPISIEWVQPEADNQTLFVNLTVREHKSSMKSGEQYKLELVNIDAATGQSTSQPLTGLDPRSASATFEYHAESVSPFDIVERSRPRQPSRPNPDLNYLARDFQSLRDVMLDRLATQLPDWKERNAADTYITAIELLAHVGDQLAYKQDAVGTESYLETARQRKSVRRHARLVDYRMHEGCNARVMLQLDVNEPTTVEPGQLYFLTQPPSQPDVPIDEHRIRHFDVGALSAVEQENFWRSVEVFEPVFEPARDAGYRDNEIAPGHATAIIAALGEGTNPLGRLMNPEILEKLRQSDVEPLPESVLTMLRDELNRIIDEEHVPVLDRAATSVTRNAAGRALAVWEADHGSPRERNRQRLDDYLRAIRVTVPAATFSTSAKLWPQHNEIHIHTWDQDDCWLPVGTTSATLRASEGQELKLQPGDLLLLEEVKGPHTGDVADADPTHRQFVRLTSVRQLAPDPLTGTPVDVPCDAHAGSTGALYDVKWHADDALQFPLCLSSSAGRCDCEERISVARGNVLLADHGRSVLRASDDGDLIVEGRLNEGCHEWGSQLTSLLFRPVIQEADLTYLEAYDHTAPAAAWVQQRPGQAVPSLELTGLPGRTDGQPAFTMESTATDFSQQVVAESWDEVTNQVGEALTALLPAELGHWFRGREFKLARPTPAKAAGVYPSLSPSASRESAIDAVAFQARDFQFTSLSHPHHPHPTLESKLSDCVRRLVRERTTWLPRFDLLTSEPDDRHVVVEMSNRRAASLRFGDGRLGQQPTAGTQFVLRYRTGNGTSGNVGAEQIKNVVYHESGTNVASRISKVRNPLAARGGIDPQPISEVKLVAPHAYREDQPRAISADDYTRLALLHFSDRIQSARAVASPLGGLTRIQLAIDPMALVDDVSALRREIRQHLERYRSIGHLLHVTAAELVPIKVCLTACVDPDFHLGSIRRDLTDLFSSGTLSDGRLGLFHPDRLTFGQSLYGGRLLSEAHSITGVVSADFAEFRIATQNKGGQSAGATGIVPDIVIGPLQIATVNHAEAEVRIELRGGR